MDIRSILQALDTIQQEAGGADPAKEKEYARAQQQMANLEKAAQYTGDDEIVRQRMGLPPKLPAIDQWDGKMPQPTGKPDWVAQLGSLGKAGDAQTAAVAQNQDNDTVAAVKKEKLPQLQQLLDKLKSMTPGQAAAESIYESLLKEFQDIVNNEAVEDKAAQDVINQINTIIGDLESMAGDDQEVTQVVASAKQAVADFEKTSQEFTAQQDKDLDAASAEADKIAQSGAGDAAAAQAAAKPTDQTAAAPADAGAAAKPAAGAGGEYVIKPGDTLGKIAKDNGTTVEEIMKANPQIKDPNKIQAGAKLNLPGKAGGNQTDANQSDAETKRLASANTGAARKRFQELLAKMKGGAATKPAEPAVDQGSGDIGTQMVAPESVDQDLLRVMELAGLNEGPLGAGLKGAWNWAKGAVAGAKGGAGASQAASGAAGKSAQQGADAALKAKDAVGGAVQAAKGQAGNVAKVGGGAVAGAATVAATSGAGTKPADGAAPAAGSLSPEERAELDKLAKELANDPESAELLKQYNALPKATAQAPAAPPPQSGGTVDSNKTTTKTTSSSSSTTGQAAPADQGAATKPADQGTGTAPAGTQVSNQQSSTTQQGGTTTTNASATIKGLDMNAARQTPEYQNILKSSTMGGGKPSRQDYQAADMKYKNEIAKGTIKPPAGGAGASQAASGNAAVDTWENVVRSGDDQILNMIRSIRF